MNHDVPDTDASILYYDADYPSLEIGEGRVGDAMTLLRIGMLGDVGFYAGLASSVGGPVLEIGCGTGRIAIPMARGGVSVVAVDRSEAMLAKFAARLDGEEDGVRGRIETVRADAVTLDLGSARFPMAAMPFNFLMLIPDVADERRLLQTVARHLEPGAVLALDVMNPLHLSPRAESRHQPSWPRLNPETGNTYIRHTAQTAIDERQVQRYYGWYEELDEDGRTVATEYSFRWRFIYRYELEFLLELCGFRVETVYGGFDESPWTPESTRIVVTARRV